MARKNNLKKRKAVIDYQRQRELEIAKKQEKRLAISNRSKPVEEISDDPIVGSVRNRKMRRRMQNELERLIRKGVKVNQVKPKVAGKAKAATKPSAMEEDVEEQQEDEVEEDAEEA